MSHLVLSEPASSQIRLDGTTLTTLTSDPLSCTSATCIQDGTTEQTGTNLFHSFLEFSVPEGDTVFFDHAPNINNIFARVTGNVPSNINGLIQTNSFSDANLFLLNPNGISFGPNGSLDLGGSFVATTADAIQFGAQGNFSALDTTTNPALLTVAPSAFLFDQTTVAPIANQSSAFSPASFFPGLAVRDNQSLLLVGGNIMLEPSPGNRFGGNLNAPSGRIELGGLRGPGIIELNITSNGLSLVYEDNASLANVSLNAANLNISSNVFNGNAAGEIVITANTFSASSSTLESFTSVGLENAGNILIQANDAINLQQGTTILSVTKASGAGGTIEISTSSLTVEESSGLSVTTFGVGSAGQVLIDAETIALRDNSNITSEALFGNPGTIQITTDSLILDEFSQISTLTSGNALNVDTSGNIAIEARDSIALLNNSNIQSQTLGQRNASPITLTTPQLTVQGLSNISASTSGTGSGGPINIIASDAVTLSNEGAITASSTGPGTAGNISIRIDGQLRVEDQAQITVSGTGSGNSGTLNVISDLVVLNDGQLLASVAAGEDGNINLNIDDALILRNDSLISAEANNNANGGNVDITSPFIIALFPDGPNGNDIKASADAGNGGLISIQANTLFNLAINQAIPGNQTNDLDATSGTGIDGDVIITTLDLEPDQGTNPLPSGLTVPEISQGCQAGNNGQFVATGQGGLSANPYAPLSNNGIQADIYPANQTIAHQPTPHLVEAQQWIRNPQGNVVLLAANTASHISCQ